MKVYLAGPIMDCTDEEATSWRAKVKYSLRLDGIQCLDPMTRDFRENGAKENMEYIVTEDLKDIDQSDLLLANVWKVSAGTSMEIFYAAHNLSIPVVAIIPKEHAVPIWIRYHATICRNVEDAIELIKDYHNYAVPFSATTKEI